jgi:hypothetical protein
MQVGPKFFYGDGVSERVLRSEAAAIAPPGATSTGSSYRVADCIGGDHSAGPPNTFDIDFVDPAPPAEVISGVSDRAVQRAWRPSDQPEWKGQPLGPNRVMYYKYGAVLHFLLAEVTLDPAGGTRLHVEIDGDGRGKYC